jgi:hypothetical protein
MENTKTKQICVYHAETAPTYCEAIRVHALQRRDSGRSSAVNISDKLSLHRIPIGAPNSIKYLAQSSYEFVLSSLLNSTAALRSLRLMNPIVKLTFLDVTFPAPIPHTHPRRTTTDGAPGFHDDAGISKQIYHNYNEKKARI